MARLVKEVLDQTNQSLVVRGAVLKRLPGILSKLDSDDKTLLKDSIQQHLAESMKYPYTKAKVPKVISTLARAYPATFLDDIYHGAYQDFVTA